MTRTAEQGNMTAMRFDVAADLFIADWKAERRISSADTERAYRYALGVLARDVANRDPSLIGKRDIQRTLARWEEPSTRKQRHAIFTAFFDWCVFEDIRDTNPARAIRPAKVRKKEVRRLTVAETHAVIDAAWPKRRERWAVLIMLLSGARCSETCILRGADFARDGYLRLFGKGSKERWVPVVPELQPVVDEIRTLVENDAYVFPGRRRSNPPHGEEMHDVDQPISRSAMFRLVRRVGQRAGLAFEIGPHTLRHAFGDSVTRYAGGRAAQTAMGHVSIETTLSTYAGAMTLDELAASMNGWGYGYARLSTRERQENPRG